MGDRLSSNSVRGNQFIRQHGAVPGHKLPRGVPAWESEEFAYSGPGEEGALHFRSPARAAVRGRVVMRHARFEVRYATRDTHAHAHALARVLMLRVRVGASAQSLLELER